MPRGHLRLEGERPTLMREAVAVEREPKSGILDKSRRWLSLGFKFCDALLKRDRWIKAVGVLDLRGNKSRRDPASSGQRNRCTCHRGEHAERDTLADRNNRPRERACAHCRGTWAPRNLRAFPCPPELFPLNNVGSTQ